MKFIAITVINSRGWISWDYVNEKLTAENFNKVMTGMGLLHEDAEDNTEEMFDSFCRVEGIEEVLENENSLFAYPGASARDGDVEGYKKALRNFKAAIKNREGYFLVGDEEEGSGMYLFDEIDEGDLQLMLLSGGYLLQKIAKEIIAEREN